MDWKKWAASLVLAVTRLENVISEVYAVLRSYAGDGTDMCRNVGAELPLYAA